MKKTSLFILIGLTNIFTINSQNKINQELSKPHLFERQKLTQAVDSKNETEQTPATLGVTVWSEDFANGLPAGWSNNGTPSTAVWTYRGPNTTPNDTVGGYGGCASGIPIESPTRSNGFFIFDSNFLDAGQSPCGDGTGSGTAPAPHTGILETAIIDLSASAGKSLILSFNSFIRNFQATEYVLISNDSGANWIQIWADEIPGNTSNAADNQEFINITPYAAGFSNVKLRFVFDGNYYEWMIDDINISEGNMNDMLLTKLFIDGADISKREYFTRIPEDLISQDSINFVATTYNFGKSDLPNVKAVFTSTKGSTKCYTDTVNAGTITSAHKDTISASTDYIHTCGKGNISVSAKIISDSIDDSPVNNVITKTFIVSDSTLARDNQTLYYIYTFNTNTAIGLYFRIEQEMVLSSVSALLFNGSTSQPAVGTIVNFSLYQFAEDGSIDPTPVAQKSSYEIKASDLVSTANFKTFMFDQAARVTKGDYIMTVEVLSGSAYILTEEKPAPYSYVLNTNDYTDVTSWRYADMPYPFLRLNFDKCALLDVNFSKTNPNNGNLGSINATPVEGKAPYTFNWASGETTSNLTGLTKGTYYVTVTDANGCSVSDSVKLIAVGIEEELFNDNDVMVYPNPSNESFIIESKNTGENISSIQITNAIGQEVARITPKSYREVIDSKEFNNGIYFIKVKTSNGNTANKQIVIKH